MSLTAGVLLFLVAIVVHLTDYYKVTSGISGDKSNVAEQVLGARDCL